MSKCIDCNGTGKQHGNCSSIDPVGESEWPCSICHGTGTAPAKCKDRGDCGIGGFCDDCPYAPAKCECKAKSPIFNTGEIVCSAPIKSIFEPAFCIVCGHAASCHKEQA